MSITFDGVSLPDDLKMSPDPHSHKKIEAETQWTRGGKQIRWERPRKSAEMDLIGGDNWGWLQRSDLTTLKAKADVLETSYVMAYHGTNYTVYFRHEDAPCIEAEEVQALRGSDELTTDYFSNVKIKLIWDFS